MQYFQEVLKFWLDKGVDGFRVDAIKYLLEDERLLNAPEMVDTEGNIVLKFQLDSTNCL